MPKEKKAKKPSQPRTYRKASGTLTGNCMVHHEVVPFTVQKYSIAPNGSIIALGVCSSGHKVSRLESKKNWDAAVASGKITVSNEIVGSCATCPYAEAPSTSGGAEGGADEDLGFLATGAAHSRGSKKSHSRGSKKGSKKSRSHSRSRGKTGGAKKSHSRSRGKAVAAKKSRSRSRGKAKKSRSRSRGKK